jgi:gamma-tubulin complex component 4
MSEIVVKEADLIGQLKIIRDFFMLGRGELFLEFLKVMQIEKIFFSKGITEATTRDINWIFQTAANNVNVTTEAEQFSLVLPSKDDLDSFCYETKGLLSLISLKYKVKWPLHLLFSPKVLEKYNDLFRFLLRIKKVQFDLQLVWRHQREKKVNKNSQLLQFRNKAMFLIDNLQYYLQVDVIESQYSILLSSIQETNDFERIERAHSVFLANVLTLCFLVSTTSIDASKSMVINLNENPVLRILDKILIAVDKFCSFCMTCNDPMTKMEVQEFKGYDQSGHS